MRKQMYWVDIRSNVIEVRWKWFAVKKSAAVQDCRGERVHKFKLAGRGSIYQSPFIPSVYIQHCYVTSYRLAAGPISRETKACRNGVAL